MVRRVRGELLDEADERLPPLWRRAPGGPAGPGGGRRPQRRARLRRRRPAAAGHRGGPARPEDPLAGGAAAAARRWSAAAGGRLPGPARLVGRRSGRCWPPRPSWSARPRSGPAGSRPSTARPNCCNAACCRSTCRTCPGCGSPPATTRVSTATPPVVTSTTPSCCPTATLGVVLGDVAGHDVQAAARMGQVRAALRALALTDPRPDAVLAGLDRLVTSLGAEAGTHELFVTVVVRGDRRRAAGADPGQRRPPRAADPPRRPGRPLPRRVRRRPGRRPRWVWAAGRRTATVAVPPRRHPAAVQRRGGGASPAEPDRRPGRPRRRRGQGRQRRPPRALRGGHRGGARAAPRTTWPCWRSSTRSSRAARRAWRCPPSRPRPAGYGTG